MIRMSRILPMIVAAALALFLYATPANPSESHVERPTTATPNATPTLPACLTEDGSGQALCMWDASEQGNGMGSDVLGGDCAYEDMSTRDMCITLYGQDAYEYSNEDGSITGVPNGKQLVAECQDEWQNDEWNMLDLYECFKAWV
jgi:hypothetical protein